MTDTIIAAAKALIDALAIDQASGLVARATIRKSDELRLAIAKHEASQVRGDVK